MIMSLRYADMKKIAIEKKLKAFESYGGISIYLYLRDLCMILLYRPQRNSRCERGESLFGQGNAIAGEGEGVVRSQQRLHHPPALSLVLSAPIYFSTTIKIFA